MAGRRIKVFLFLKGHNEGARTMATMYRCTERNTDKYVFLKKYN